MVFVGTVFTRRRKNTKIAGSVGIMRTTKRSGNFLLCFLINLLLNFEWSIPAWILLALHFLLGIPIWWFIGGLGFWILAIFSEMWIMGLMISVGNEPLPEKPNKNPYSIKGDKQ